MKVLGIGALLVACAVLATARPSPQLPQSDMTQALLQTMGREESYKLALIQTISELLDMKQEQAEAEQNPNYPDDYYKIELEELLAKNQGSDAESEQNPNYPDDYYTIEQEENEDENQGGLIWNTGNDNPGKNNEAQEAEKMSMQDILELIGKLQEEDQAKEEGYGQSKEQLENEVEDEQLPLEDIEAQDTDKMSMQDILELIGKLQEEDQAKEEDEWEAREQVPSKETRTELAQIQTPNKTDLEIMLEMINQLKGEEKAQEQFDSIGHSEREGAEMQEKETMSLEDILNLLDQVEEEQADDSSRQDEAEEQEDDSSRRDEELKGEEQDKDDILEGLSKKLYELQTTLQSINELVNMQRGK